MLAGAGGENRYYLLIENKGSDWSDKNFLKLCVVVVAQFGKCTKYHWMSLKMGEC